MRFVPLLALLVCSNWSPRCWRLYLHRLPRSRCEWLLLSRNPWKRLFIIRNLWAETTATFNCSSLEPKTRSRAQMLSGWWKAGLSTESIFARSNAVSFRNSPVYRPHDLDWGHSRVSAPVIGRSWPRSTLHLLSLHRKYTLFHRCLRNGFLFCSIAHKTWLSILLTKKCAGFSVETNSFHHTSILRQAIQLLAVSMGAQCEVDPQIKLVMEQHCSLISSEFCIYQQMLCVKRRQHRCRVQHLEPHDG